MADKKRITELRNVADIKNVAHRIRSFSRLVAVANEKAKQLSNTLHEGTIAELSVWLESAPVDDPLYLAAFLRVERPRVTSAVEKEIRTALARQGGYGKAAKPNKAKETVWRLWLHWKTEDPDRDTTNMHFAVSAVEEIKGRRKRGLKRIPKPGTICNWCSEFEKNLTNAEHS